VETTQGEIYFIREHEVGGFSPYTKIGLITYKNDRNSQSRISEHQTGNPRELSVFRYVPTFCVSAAETYMHRKYASLRFHGEWFQLSESQILEAVDFCESLAKRFDGEKEVLDKADALRDIVSNGQISDSSEESQEWQREYLRADGLIKKFESAVLPVKQLILSIADSGGDVSGIADVQTRSVSNWDEPGFKGVYPDIWTQFLIEKRNKRRFTVVRVKDVSHFTDNSLSELIERASRLEEILSDSTGCSVVPSGLKEAYLDLLPLGNQAKVDKEIAEAHLKVLCAENDGVQSVCKWSRETVKEELDKKALKSNHPNEYAEFESRGAPVKAVVLQKRIGSDIDGE
jgi:hypothetical protein